MKCAVVPIQCPQCKVMIKVEACEEQQISNHETVSILVVQHKGQVMCPSCQTISVPAIARVGQIGFVLLPVPPEKQDSVVVMPGRRN